MRKHAAVAVARRSRSPLLVPSRGRPGPCEANSNTIDQVWRRQPRRRRFSDDGSRACPCEAAGSCPLSRSDALSRPSASSTRFPARTAPCPSSRGDLAVRLGHARLDEQLVHTDALEVERDRSTSGTSAATVSSAASEAPSGRHRTGRRQPLVPRPRRRGREPTPSSRRPGRAGPAGVPVQQRAGR